MATLQQNSVWSCFETAHKRGMKYCTSVALGGQSNVHFFKSIEEIPAFFYRLGYTKAKIMGFSDRKMPYDVKYVNMKLEITQPIEENKS